MTHRLAQLQLQCIIERVPLVEHSAYRAEVWIYLRTTTFGGWPQIALGRERRKNHIYVIGTERHMHASRAHKPHRCCQAWRQLPLDIQVPLHNVVAMWIRFDVRTAEG